MKKKLLTREEILCADDLNPGKARLCRIALRVREGREQNLEDMAAIADAFEKILAGADPAKALDIGGVPGQGRPPKSSGEEDTTELFWSYEVVELRRQKRITVAAAMDTVAYRNGIAPSTLERYYKKHRETAEWLYEGIVRALARKAGRASGQ